jgi:hypothetical protein
MDQTFYKTASPSQLGKVLFGKTDPYNSSILELLPITM